jgi:hypothetical protein
LLGMGIRGLGDHHPSDHGDHDAHRALQRLLGRPALPPRLGEKGKALAALAEMEEPCQAARRQIPL